MLNFESDYTEGAHEQLLRRLWETNYEQLSGYGNDKYCNLAKEKIKKECGKEDAEVFFISGGTQTNQIVISSLLQPWQGVISAESGHINTHEAGAIECTGHKVLTLPQYGGKLKAEDLSRYMADFYADGNHEHTVFPGMVYISHPTEYGTLYTKEELEALSAVCRRYELPLYMDGARLGYGIMSRGSNVTMPVIAELCDVFYIGGTKVGALCGEAVVFTRGNAPKHFFTLIKQHGALLAKGRLMGVQFDALFTDGLYYKISRHAIEMADIMRNAFANKGYRFLTETVTNQIFVILDNKKAEELGKHVAFSFWEKIDEEHSAYRFASSWATKKENVDRLVELL